MRRAVRVGLHLAVIAGLVVLGLAAPERLVRNTRGHHAAPPGGDLGLGPAPGGDLVGRDAAACGAAGPTARGAFHRRPYLQRTTADATAILWTAPPGPPAEVRLWSADRVDARTVAPAIDPVPAPDGATQWIVEIDRLRPATLYCYDVAAGGDRRFGPVGFRTAPGPDGVARALAFGDMGFRTADQAAVLAQLLRTPADLALLAGDIAYPYGRPEELDDNVFAVYAPIMARVPFFPAAGNHDYLTDEGAPLRAAFALPENGGDEGRERWYSFDWGPLHVVVLDSERLVPAQLAWLERDLAASRRPWRIAVTHRPPFSAGAHGDHPASKILLHPLFARHRVDLVLTGHDHDYERTIPIDGVVYVVTGGGGRGTYRVGRTARTAFAAEVAHHVLLEADPAELRLWAIDATGATFDTLRLAR